MVSHFLSCFGEIGYAILAIATQLVVPKGILRHRARYIAGNKRASMLQARIVA